MNVCDRTTLAASIALSLTFVAGCQEQGSKGLMTTRVSAASLETSGKNPVAAPVANGKAHAALESAAQSGRYLYIFLTKAEDQSTESMRKVFRDYVESIRDRADAVEISVTAASEKRFVDEYGLSRAPMPLALAFAPNGAATGGFHTNFTADDLAAGMVSPIAADCMKYLQDGQLVVLSVQNAETIDNDAARAGAEEFAQDAKYRDSTRLVVVDPTDEAERSFLKDLDVSPATATAVTVLMAPPGSPIAKFEGATTKAAFVEAVAKATSGCCPGGQCGPGGCQPQ